MSAKFEKFKAALIALCDAHQVTISSSEYDSIQIWDRDHRNGAIFGGDEPLEDRTKQINTNIFNTDAISKNHLITK